MKRVAIGLVAILLLSMLATADEGMWLFNNPPKDQIKVKYNFDLTPEFLDHLRLSSVKIGGGSSSFVSPDGLLFTNHHVAQGCIHNLSTAGKDYMKDGFYAASREQEPKCPGLEARVLQSIEDVTPKITAVAKPGMSPAETGKAQRAAMSELENACSTAGMRCEVVTLYAGGMYHLYKYRLHTDIRLVFAPEFDIAFYGGDPDNFTFPRYDLDITFFRIYENDRPLKVDHYLKWAPTGVKENDLVFVSGHPGSTGRLLTTAQLEYLRDVQYPFILKLYKHRIELLESFSKQSAENARVAESELFSLQNAYKAITGYNVGLVDITSMERKAKEEKMLQKFVDADQNRKALYGESWNSISKAVATQKQLFKPYNFYEGTVAFRGRLAEIARLLVRVTAEKEKPNTDRLRGYQDSNIPSIEQKLFSAAPIYKTLEAANLADGLTWMRNEMSPSDPIFQKVLTREPEGIAENLVWNTRLESIEYRKQLYEGGRAAVEASTDPMIVLMRSIDAEGRAIRQRWDDEVDSVLRQNGSLIAKVRFDKYGTSVPPDATGTLRLSYGVVKGYKENGQKIPWATTIGGAYELCDRKADKFPWDLPPRWHETKSKLDPNTPFNVAATPDIIGGNSGSPVVNIRGEVVGIIFDGNIQSLPWNFMYDDQVGRAVHADGRAILESLRKVYDAQQLAGELVGTGANQGGAAH
jgi:hypothetical protein